MNMKLASLASLALMLVALFVITPSSMAQTNGMQDNQASGMPPGATNPNMQVQVMGCLKKGSESGGYYLTDQSGHTWELVSSKVDLGEHVNHSVTITGKPAELSSQQEMAHESGEKSEAAGNQHSDLRVLSLKMMSPSCTR
jgi:hypothetical protein